MKAKLARFVYKVLGETAPYEHPEQRHPPGSTQKIYFEPDDPRDERPYATTEENDGFELYLVIPDRQLLVINHKMARKLAWFVLWTWWIESTWCGLKRFLWYKALMVIRDG